MMAAEQDESKLSLLSLEEDLTCSICLSTFDCPVTIPCGHNFCHDCLLATWKDSYSCPQCRTLFATKPELKKNTVLSTVVDTFKGRSSKGEALSESEPKGDLLVRCDFCMEAEAAQTCLTCMASFCEEHLRPHRENPNFRLHQLSQPVGDLMEHICPDHHKLMELFCTKHARLICSFCLQQVHKGCSYTSLEEQRNLKETDLRAKIGLLDGKISRNKTVLSMISEVERKLQDSATTRKKAVLAEYQHMKAMLAREECEVLKAVDREVEMGQTKIKDLMAKFTDNVDNMNKAKEEIHRLLNQTQTLAFLQAPFNLPPAVNFDPYTPRLSLDSKKVKQSEAFTAALKNFLVELLKHPHETRITILQRELMFPPPPLMRLPRSHSPGPPAKAGQKKKPPNKKENTKSPLQSAENTSENLKKSMENLKEYFGARGCQAAAEPRENPGTSELPPKISSAEKRSELLKYDHVFMFDPRTAHKRIALSENFTKASVSDEHTNYVDCPERFAVCSQVLGSKGFSKGRHYWEVRLSSNNFIGIGLAYGSIDRKGPTSRLGRNDKSWCVEWFNVKLSAWHSSNELILANPSPKRVGVLLDCEEGKATFYNVADRAYPFHSFAFKFTEAVYPAFWIFSSGSFITLCKLQ
uniref:Tripartite motif containing 25 n=1 Tax=Nothobranchius kadleci TaxID=1051664 RepID=A0A1A8CAI7_NOTKA